VTKAVEAAEVSVRTARKWVRRSRADGEEGLVDRSSSPLRQPTRTGEERVQRLRRLRLTGAQVAEALWMALWTVAGT
jgi:transposase